MRYMGAMRGKFESQTSAPSECLLGGYRSRTYIWMESTDFSFAQVEMSTGQTQCPLRFPVDKLDISNCSPEEQLGVVM